MQKDSRIGWYGFWSQPGGSDGGGSRPVPPLPTPLRPKSAQSRVMRPIREFAALPAQLRTSVRSCAGALRCSRSGSHLGDYLSAMCSRQCLEIMAKLAIPEIGLNKAARAVAGWSPCTHEQRSSSGFRVCRGAIWPKFRPAAFAKALRHSCRAAFAALRGLNLGSNQQSHYFQTLPRAFCI